jgi:hypothetical protein
MPRVRVIAMTTEPNPWVNGDPHTDPSGTAPEAIDDRNIPTREKVESTEVGTQFRFGDPRNDDAFDPHFNYDTERTHDEP